MLKVGIFSILRRLQNIIKDLNDIIMISSIYIMENVVFTLALITTSLLGDYLVFTWLNGYPGIYRAIGDSLTHGLIGLFSWLIIDKSIIKAFGCMATAMLVDSDRFIEAQTLDLNKALNLAHRPFLHNSTIPLIFFLIAILINLVINNHKFKLISSLVFVALFTHQLRDASRRGLWFWPWIQSLPIQPYPLYIALIIVLSFSVKYYVMFNSKTYDVINV